MSADIPRREFFRRLGAGALALPATSCDPERLPDRKLGVALVGLGTLSEQQLAPALTETERCRLAAIVTGSPAKARAWQDRYGIAASHVYDYDGFDRIADDRDVDIVYIVLPNSMHRDFTVRAAKAGKHVLCEKPMAPSVRECEEMIAACDRAGVRLAVGYRCQFEPHNVECMRLAREEVFGKVRIIEAGFGIGLRDPRQWRLDKELAGGGALMDVGIYALQATRYLTGEEPVRVSALETKTDPKMFAEVDETIVWSAEFPSGVLANCATTYGFHGYNRFWVGAERGWFGLDPAYSYGPATGKRSDGKPLKLAPTNQFVAELDDFARCVQAGEQSRVSGEEGLADLRVIEAIYRSVREKRTVEVG